MSGNDLSDGTQDVDDSIAASKCGAPDKREFNAVTANRGGRVDL
jgi:hypothetical protein